MIWMVGGDVVAADGMVMFTKKSGEVDCASIIQPRHGDAKI